MHSLFTQRRAYLALALVLFASLVVGATSGTPNVRVDLSGTVARGGRQVSLEDAGRVNPGEVITWSVTVSNVGNSPASNINVVGDVDDGTAYVPGSAAGDGVSSVKYSLGHPQAGQPFSERPMVSVVVGGVTQTRPASPDKYKAVQFTFQGIGAGEVKRATYRTRVR